MGEKKSRLSASENLTDLPKQEQISLKMSERFLPIPHLI